MEYPTYLIHYGTLGQKWGERRWQHEDGSLTPEGYIHYGYGKSGKQRKEYLESRERIKSGTATAKDLITRNGSSNISALDGSYTNIGYQITNKYISSGLGTKLMDELEESGNVFDYSSGLKRVNPALTLKQNSPLNIDDELVMKSVTRRINPNYGERGTTNNCVRCTTAMTLAKMGYSTPQGISAGRALNGAESAGFSYWFDGAEMKTVDTVNEAENELKSQPKGSFGEFAISRYDANGNRIGGHSMAYSVLSDGSIRIEEGQAGKIFHSIKDAMENCGASEKQIMITRLDNTKPNMKAIAEDNMVDIGGNRTSDPTYMVRDINKVTLNDSGEISRYSWRNSGHSVPYSQVGRLYDGTLSGRSKNKDIVYDDEGYMSLNKNYNGSSRVSSNEQSMIRALESSGKTQEEIAKLLGLSVSTISKYS